MIICKTIHSLEIKINKLIPNKGKSYQYLQIVSDEKYFLILGKHKGKKNICLQKVTRFLVTKYFSFICAVNSSKR
jgi:hypothetical protein